MAKDLPYFKFFCSEWNDGDITLEDFNVQGLFINVCSYYWSNECYLSIDKLKKRFKHNKTDIDYLLKSDLLHDENGFLSIHFLDEQQEDRKATSKKNSEAGKASAERRRLAKIKQESNIKPTIVEISLNENSTIKRREDKKREEKIRKENINFTNESFLIWFKECRQYLGLQYNVKRLSITEKQLFNELKDYTKEDFKLAFKNFSNDKYWSDNNLLLPSYFLKSETFTKYLNAEVKKELTLGEKLIGKTL